MCYSIPERVDLAFLLRLMHVLYQFLVEAIEETKRRMINLLAALRTI